MFEINIKIYVDHSCMYAFSSFSFFPSLNISAKNKKTKKKVFFFGNHRTKITVWRPIVSHWHVYICINLLSQLSYKYIQEYLCILVKVFFHWRKHVSLCENNISKFAEFGLRHPWPVTFPPSFVFFGQLHFENYFCFFILSY